MAVSEQTPYIEYTSNGTTTSFALNFDCNNQDHLIVTVDDVEPVVGAWSLSNGAVVFDTAPENGKKITLQRNTPFSRTTDYQSYNNSFRPPAVNKDFDWIWWKLQELGVADWILSNRIDALKACVDQQDSELQQNIDNLKIYVDDKDDELRAYLLEEIRKQGVALDQLDEYYNYLMQRLAQIAIDKGWEASFVVDASGKTQQEINDSIAVKFLLAKEIGLTHWDNPDKKPPYTAQEYEQAYNNGIRLGEAVKAAYDEGYSLAVLERGTYPLFYNAQQSQNSFENQNFSGLDGHAVVFRNIKNFHLHLNNSKFFVIFDSDNKSPYDTRTTNTPYNLAGSVFSTKDVEFLEISNGEIKGDMYNRSWSNSLESNTENTRGINPLMNSRFLKLTNMKIHGFRGDGVSGSSRGYNVATNFGWVEGGIDSSGNLITSTLNRTSALISLVGKSIINNALQIMTSSYTREPVFGNDRFLVSFYTADDVFISQEYSYPTVSMHLPANCAKVRFTIFNTPLSIDIGTVWLVTGSSEFMTIDGCEIFANMRGCISNLPNASVVRNCKLYDVGKFIQKYGFIDYTSSTKYAINNEDVYVQSLTVRDCEMTNTEHPFIALTKNVFFENNNIHNSTYPARLYTCKYASITGNDFGGSGLFVSFNDTIMSRHAVVSNNRFTDGVAVFQTTSKHLIVHTNNLYDRCRVKASGGGFMSSGNIYKNIVGLYGESMVFDRVGAWNDKIFAPDTAAPNNAGYRQIKVSLANSNDTKSDGFIDLGANVSNISSIVLLGEGEKYIAPSLKYYSPILKNIEFKLSDKTAKTSDDEYNFFGTQFENINLRFERNIGVTEACKTIVKFDKAQFVNSTIQLDKLIEVSSDSSFVFKSCEFDLTAITRLFTNTRESSKPISVLFIDCLFISDTQKNIALIQGQLANITSQAIGCRFINVTNTDSLMVIS